MMKSKRPGCRENGEIDTRDAYQIEIFCSWPQLFGASSEIAKQVNRDGGFLRIAEPGMPSNGWAHRVNEYKGLGLIPGFIRQRDLWWDGLKITQLIDKLSRIMMFGTPDLQNLPGYDPQQPDVLTCDAGGLCLIDDKHTGLTAHTALFGRVAHIDTLLSLEEATMQRRWNQVRTPATMAIMGLDLYGADNLPDAVSQSKQIPDDGSCTIKAHCVYCGMRIKARGMLRKGHPHYEIDTQPICNHLRLRIQPTLDGEHYELHVMHVQNLPECRTASETELSKWRLSGGGDA